MRQALMGFSKLAFCVTKGLHYLTHVKIHISVASDCLEVVLKRVGHEQVFTPIWKYVMHLIIALIPVQFI